MQSKTVDAYGTQVHYLEGGDGPPLLLLHGIGESSHSWAANLDALAEHFHLYVPDIVGWGHTPPPPQYPYTIAGLADFTLAFMDAVGLERTRVIGWSLGGAGTLHAALKAAERFERVMLIAPAGLGKEVHWIFRVLDIPVVGYLGLMPNMLTMNVIYKLLFTRRRHTATREFMQRALKAHKQPWHRATTLKTLRVNRALQQGQAAVDVHERVGELTMPVHIVWGQQDIILPLWHGERAVEAMPNAELTVFDDCGHMPMLEHAAEFNTLAIKFFVG